MRTIEIDDDVMTALKAEAEPFADTPNSVLRRILGLHKASPSRVGAEKARSQADTEGPSEGNRARARAGTILPEEEYMLPLLEVLQQQGAGASARGG